MFKDEGNLTSGNTEIQAALQEFEAKSDGASAVPSALGIADAPVSASIAPPKSGMVEFIIKYSGGLVKNSEQANYVLLTIFAVFMGLSVYLFWGAKGKTPEVPAQNFQNQAQFPS